jgi:hypothetical protein
MGNLMDQGDCRSAVTKPQTKYCAPSPMTASEAAVTGVADVPARLGRGTGFAEGNG